MNSQSVRKVTDILRLNDQYRIDIVADPEVPMLDIYANADGPKRRRAGQRSGGSVEALSLECRRR